MIQGILRLPITIRVPAVVALITVGVSVLISERVLSRLTNLQREHLVSLSTAYMDGLASALQPAVLRDDVWEAFDVIDRSGLQYESVRPVETLVVDSEGRTLAASEPGLRAVGAVPATDFRSRFLEGDLQLAPAEERAYVHRPLIYQDREIGELFAVLDVNHLFAERKSVLVTLVATNSLLALLFASLGYVTVRGMVRPLRILADHLHRGLESRPETIAAPEFPHRDSEFARLFTSYNALVKAEQEREVLAANLSEEERLASLGRLASGMAHEINNPLGGLFNALDTIKRHGESRSVRDTAASILERGLNGIRDVVSAALHTYRSDHTPRPFSVLDLEDISILVRPELRRRRLVLDWSNRLQGSFDIPNAPLRQAALNLLLNACAAAPEYGQVALNAEVVGEVLAITIEDSGPGLPQSAAAILTDGDVPAPIGNGSGLGLWMVRRLATELNGTIALSKSPLGGARICLTIPIKQANVEDQEVAYGAA